MRPSRLHLPVALAVAAPRFVDVQPDLRRANFRLAPGSPGIGTATAEIGYTAHVTDSAGRTGEALLEIYEAP